MIEIKNLSKFFSTENGDFVAINDIDLTNEARALRLIQQEGFIKLKDGAGLNATPNDIIENSNHIKFYLTEPEFVRIGTIRPVSL